MPTVIDTITNITLEPYFEKELHQAFASYGKILNNRIPLEDIFEFNKSEVATVADYIVVVINFCSYFGHLLPSTFNSEYGNEFISSATRITNDLYDNIRSNYIGKIVWVGYENYSSNLRYVLGHTYAIESIVDCINRSVHKHISSDDVFIDMKGIIAEIGIDKAFDSKNKYRWNSPYSKALLRELAKEIFKVHQIEHGLTKKCLILDCDNVLWGGVLFDDGIENILLSNYGLGQVYQDFQKFVLFLYQTGVILAVCSKNDEKEVLQVFHQHSGMILREEHISCLVCNLESKVENIKAISRALNIGLDSMVFVDDSESEINAVKALLPEVTSILFSKYTIYCNLSCFSQKATCDMGQIIMRTKAYQTNLKRRELWKNAKSFDNYLLSLDVKIDIHESLPSESARISELSQRTNKWTNGVRYTTQQIKNNLEQDGYALYTVTVSDKFSDLGIVGTIGIYNKTLDLIALSCRAFGRGVEKYMIDYLESFLISDFKYSNTGKNIAIQELIQTILTKELSDKS